MFTFFEIHPYVPRLVEFALPKMRMFAVGFLLFIQLIQVWAIQSDSDNEQIVYPQPLNHFEWTGQRPLIQNDVDGPPSSWATGCGEDREPGDHKVIQSLVGMMQSVHTMPPHTCDWLQFVKECAESANCSVANLCREYPHNFNCDAQGQLEGIYIYRGHLEGALALSMIPHSVNILHLNQNKLQSIGTLKDLKGKSLECLNVARNPLVLNLSDLSSNRCSLPLRTLIVSKCQIGAIIGERTGDKTLREWVRRSSLNCLIVTWVVSRRGGRHRYRRVRYFKNGTVDSNIPDCPGQ